MFINIMKNSLLILLCLIAGGSVAGAKEFTDSVSVYFRQSHIDIDSDFSHNGERLDSIIGQFSGAASGENRFHLHNVKVTGAASPEGSVEFNDYLSEKRAEAIFSLMREYGITDDNGTKFNYLGRDWSGLYNAVQADRNVPYRDEVQGLLQEIAVAGDVTHPLMKLKKLHGGGPYYYMYTHIFPSLRMSKIVFSYDRLLTLDSEIKPALLPVDIAYSCHDMNFDYIFGSVKECKPFYLGLKTNMLYDLLLIPNIGADLYIGKGWSVTADWMYGWWDKNSTHYYWRAYGGTLGVRKWFGKKAAEKPLTGHHVGVYAGAVTYDFELGGKGYMGGKPHGTLWERCNFVGGVEYGYSLPVARRLNIDFAIGLGYVGGKYLEYVPKDGFYMWQSTHRLNWFGPTKAEVSLVWLIGCDNFNRSKGGRL